MPLLNDSRSLSEQFVMPSQNSLALPPLENAIDRHPLVIRPETPVTDVLSLMHQSSNTCTLPDAAVIANSRLPEFPSTTCAIITQAQQILGIFTERDILKLTATGKNLAGVSVAEVMTRSPITLTLSPSQNLFTVLSLFRQHQIRHLPIVNPAGILIGLITQQSIRQVLHPNNFLKVRRVQEVMTAQVITAPPQASVLQLAQLMAQHQVSCIIISSDGQKLPLGIVTEGDIVQMQALALGLAQTPAQEVMSTPVFCLKPTDSLMLAHKTMQQHHIHRLVICDDRHEIVGIVTQSNLLRALDPVEMYVTVEQLQQSVSQLEAEKLEILHKRNAELERQVQERTAQLHQANRALKTLSECNQALVRATEESELLHDTCRIILETGGYRLAWVSFTSGPPASDRCPHIPIFNQTDTLEFIELNETENEGCDPSQIAVETGKPCIIRYDDNFQSQSDYAAAIAFPLKQSYCVTPNCDRTTARCFGTLNIYAAQANAFDREEVQLLSKLADDLAYGIVALRTRAERERTQIELDRIFNLSLDLLCIASFNGYFKRINPAFSKTLGYSSEELLSTPFLEFVHPQDRLATILEMQQLTQGQPTIYFENRYRTQDGTYRWLAWTAVPVMPEKVVYAVARDITDRKWAQEALLKSQQKLALHVQQTPLAVIEWNLDGEVTEWNPAAEKIFGYSRQEVLGQQATALLVPEYLRDRVNSLLHYPLESVSGKLAKPVFERELGFRSTHENLTKDGRPIICEWYNTPLVDQTGKVIGITSLALDITKRKQAENALQQANEVLELRVESRTAELMQTLEQLKGEIKERQRLEIELRTSLEKEKELNELKSRFISMVSHDFRTPLTTIQSSAELLEHYSYRWNEEKKLTHLRRMQSAVGRMTQMLEDILTIGRADAGKLQFNPTAVDLRQFCSQLVEEMQLSMGKDRKLVFLCQGNCHDAIADEKLLHHIFSNLLSNAIKYSPNGGTVTLELICPEESCFTKASRGRKASDRVASFQVSDSGIGIPAEEISQLFTAFHRCSNVGNIAGTGLGLTIVKKCVDIHGGAIAVESQIGAGTTFTVTLPLGY